MVPLYQTAVALLEVKLLLGEMMLPLFLLLLFSGEALRRLSPQGNLLQAYRHRWRMFLKEDGQVVDLGVKTVEVAEDTHEGTPCWRITVTREITSRATRLIDTLYLDRETLTPFVYNNEVPNIQEITLAAKEGALQGSFERKGDQSRALEESIDDPSYDFAFLAPLLTALPLDDGFRVSFPFYHYLEGETQLTVEVVGAGREQDQDVLDVAVSTDSGQKVVYRVDRARRIPLRESVANFYAELID